MLAEFRTREDLFVVRCFVCRKEVPLVDSDGAMRRGHTAHIFVCTPCMYKAKTGKDLPPWQMGVDKQAEIDNQIEATEPEDVFGPHLGSELRRENEARAAWFRRSEK